MWYWRGDQRCSPRGEMGGLCAPLGMNGEEMFCCGQVTLGPLLSEPGCRVPLGAGTAGGAQREPGQRLRVTGVVFIPEQNCPQHTRMASVFAEESKEQILSVGPIRRKRKCGTPGKAGGSVCHPSLRQPRPRGLGCGSLAQLSPFAVCAQDQTGARTTEAVSRSAPAGQTGLCAAV